MAMSNEPVVTDLWSVAIHKQMGEILRPYERSYARVIPKGFGFPLGYEERVFYTVIQKMNDVRFKVNEDLDRIAAALAEEMDEWLWTEYRKNGKWFDPSSLTVHVTHNNTPTGDPFSPFIAICAKVFVYTPITFPVQVATQEEELS